MPIHSSAQLREFAHAISRVNHACKDPCKHQMREEAEALFWKRVFNTQFLKCLPKALTNFVSIERWDWPGKESEAWAIDTCSHGMNYPLSTIGARYEA
jgi:hypothetical protein